MHTGQVGDLSRSFYQGQRLDLKLGFDRQASEDPGAQSHEQDMEIGYADNTSPQTFEGLDHKFLDDIMKLTKEQNDAEDLENARHREKISEINAQYQEKLTVLRARQVNRRDKFLHRESQARQHQYQEARISHYPNSMGPSDAHRYSGASSGAAVNEAHQAHAPGQFDSYRELAQFLGGGRSHGLESRGPYPGGRVYGTGSRNYR